MNGEQSANKSINQDKNVVVPATLDYGTILIARNRKYRQPGKGGGQADNILIIFCTSGAVVHK
jgi:hypothetical protein